MESILKLQFSFLLLLLHGLTPVIVSMTTPPPLSPTIGTSPSSSDENDDDNNLIGVHSQHANLTENNSTIFDHLQSQGVEVVVVGSLQRVILQTTLSRVAVVLYLKEEWIQNDGPESWTIQHFLGLNKNENDDDSDEITTSKRLTMTRQLYVVNCDLNFTQCHDLQKPQIWVYRNGEVVQVIDPIQLQTVSPPRPGESTEGPQVVVGGNEISKTLQGTISGNRDHKIRELRGFLRQQRRLVEQMQNVLLDQERRLEEL